MDICSSVFNSYSVIEHYNAKALFVTEMWRSRYHYFSYLIFFSSKGSETPNGPNPQLLEISEF